MSKLILNPKNYEGTELETIFFRPLLSGPTAIDLGVRIMYNMPVPTILNFWKRSPDVLKKYAKGWSGSSESDKFQKTIALSKVKAEMGYAAADYVSMVWEQVVGGADVNLGDLSGTELEAAETELFRRAIAESIRSTMWLGDTTRVTGGFDTFDGLLKRIKADSGIAAMDIKALSMTDMTVESAAEELFKKLYDSASMELRGMKAEGNLVMLVTRDVYENYEAGLLSGDLDSVRNAKINGIESLYYRGIPVIDMQIDGYLPTLNDLPDSWAIFTDRRNLAMAVNTSDFPGAEVSMWYNPDEIENRQRAIFMAGCDYLLPELIVAAF